MKVKIIRNSSIFYGHIGVCRESKAIPGCYLVKLDKSTITYSFAKEDLEFLE